MKWGRKRKGIAVMVLFAALYIMGCGRTGLPEKVLTEELKEGESWTDCLLEAVEREPYAYALIQVSADSADFSWGLCEDAAALAAEFSGKKEDGIRTEGNGEPWYFVKIRLEDGVYGTDIFDYFQQNLQEEGYEYEVLTMDEGNAYVIRQVWSRLLEEESRRCMRRSGVVRDGYLYILSCEGTRDENRESVNVRIRGFMKGFMTREDSGGWRMDEDKLYWADHTERISSLEDPKREFTEIRAVDINWPDKLMGYYGMLQEAKYWVKPAPDMPELAIRFRLAQNAEAGQETFLLNGFSMEEGYRMEIRDGEDGRLLQEENIELCMYRTDTVSFEDLDGDGYLDMRIVYPSYQSGADETEIAYERYFLWNAESRQMVSVEEEELKVRKEEAGAEPGSGTGAEGSQASGTEAKSVGYIVEKGDCLWSVAELYYGDGRRWTDIYERNRERIGDDPSLVLEGAELDF